MELCELTSQMGHEMVVFCQDQATGLQAIIAIHDTTLGPALGGCRFWPYPEEDDAWMDVLRLSRGMTYKAAVAGLRLGGGKSVIIGDPAKLKTPELLRAFGRFVGSLGGRYITAEDVNIRVEDMNHVAEETSYVTGISSRQGGSGDPSPLTALGVYSGIKASVKHRLGQDSLRGLRVGVQGCGSVGRYLCDLLAGDGAKLVVADINPQNYQGIVSQHGAEVVTPDEIHRQTMDVFAPCALGGILNPETIPDLQCPVVAGGANNQLADESRDGKALLARNILYAPDYVINAGGLINVAHELKGYDRAAAEAETRNIGKTMLEIFAVADSEGIPTHEASDRVALGRIAAERGNAGGLKTFDNQEWIKVS